MKILYTRHIDTNQEKRMQQDYLCDVVIHGLRSLGEEVIDVPRLWYMYKNEFGSGKNNLNDLYGRGFTIFATLDEDLIDRTDIELKIRNRYFDLIVIARIDYGTPYLSLILENYPPSKIIILDGQDSEKIYSTYLTTCGTYFKRELRFSDPHIFPISFAFPKEKIQQVNYNKSKIISQIKPNYNRSYLFDNEKDYYNEYNESLFAYTQCKVGWDVMRHYEIMACRSIPIFYGIDVCPEYTCTTLPKKELLEILNKHLQDGFDWFTQNLSYCYEMEEKIHQHFLKHCTTEVLAKYILDTHFSRVKL
jgi:hypothetical protein